MAGLGRNQDEQTCRSEKHEGDVGQTGAGSWEYLQRSGFEAKRLREQVTSPGGTTAAALKQLDDADFTGLVVRALQAAERRGKELAALG